MTPEDYVADRTAELGPFIGPIIGGIYDGIRHGAYDTTRRFRGRRPADRIRAGTTYFASLTP